MVVTNISDNTIIIHDVTFANYTIRFIYRLSFNPFVNICKYVHKCNKSTVLFTFISL